MGSKKDTKSSRIRALISIYIHAPLEQLIVEKFGEKRGHIWFDNLMKQQKQLNIR